MRPSGWPAKSIGVAKRAIGGERREGRWRGEERWIEAPERGMRGVNNKRGREEEVAVAGGNETAVI